MFHIQTQFCTGWRVLLLEAGPDESEASDIPVLANSMQGGLFDWQYKVGLVYILHDQNIQGVPKKVYNKITQRIATGSVNI